MSVNILIDDRFAFCPTSLIMAEEPSLIAKGKVRDIYSTADPNALLFVATDRVSAFDVVMKNVCGHDCRS